MLISGSSTFEVFSLPSPLLIVRLKCHSIQGHPTHTAGAEGAISSAIYLSRICRIKCHPMDTRMFVAHGYAKMVKLGKAPTLKICIAAGFNQIKFCKKEDGFFFQFHQHFSVSLYKGTKKRTM